MKPRPKVGMYVRVSTDHQTTASQRPALRQWASSAHIRPEDIRWYEDRQSGKTMDRTALQRLLKAVDAGAIDCVVVYDLSRFARNFIEGVQTLADLAKKCRVVSVSENIDFSNSTGMLIAQIMLSISAWSRLQTVEKIRQGMIAARENGKHVGRPRDEKRLARIQKMQRDGLKVREIAERLGCSRANIYATLSRIRKGSQLRMAV